MLRCLDGHETYTDILLTISILVVPAESMSERYDIMSTRLVGYIKHIIDQTGQLRSNL